MSTKEYRGINGTCSSSGWEWDLEQYAYSLHCEKELTARERIALVSYFGNAGNVYKAEASEISQVLGKLWFKTCPEETALKDAYRRLTDRGIRFLGYEDPRYPEKLRCIHSAPYGLYVSGQLPVPDHGVAIVGSRRCTGYGRRMARELGLALGEAGIPVISGMARGIDSIAQEAVLEAGGTTAAVLGCGVDMCYPGELKHLYLEIQKKGCLISEFPPGTEPLPQHFPARNRIISGLADTVIVVEAAEKSGSLITADMALDQGRDVYVCPGRITDIQSAGCNRLIAQGAGIITDIDAFLEEIGVMQQDGQTGDDLRADRQTGDDLQADGLRGDGLRHDSLRKDNLSPEELEILALLDAYPRTIEEIETELPPGEVLQKLTLLELKGRVCQQTPGKYILL